MALVYLGTDFHDTPLTELEQFETASDEIRKAVDPMNSAVEGVVVLATCNRFEVYFETSNFHDSIDRVTAQIAQALSKDVDWVKSKLKVLYADAVAEHLFSVAAGLESMIVGEEEIAGQVKRSLNQAQKLGHASKALNHLFQTAASVAKNVTTESGLGASGRSVINTALDIAAEKLGGLAGRSALLIGTGAYSRVVAAALHRLEVNPIYVYSRSGRAEKFSSTHNTVALENSDFERTMAEVDLVVSASGTRGFAITEELASRVVANRTVKEPLAIIDVSLSRDVAPEVAALPSCFVIDLEQVKNKAPQEHSQAIETAREIVSQSLKAFESAVASRKVDPVVSALRAHVGLWVRDEIDSVRRKSGDETAQEVERSLRKVANAILHTPSVKAKELAIEGNQDDYIRAVKLLFDIEVSDRE